MARDQAAMTLKLMLAVYCAVVAFAAPPGKQGTVYIILYSYSNLIFLYT